VAADRADRSRPAAAWTKGTHLAAHHAQIRGRRGTQKAIGATRHDILIAYCHIVAIRSPASPPAGPG
jgi:hypothetical protein